MTLTYGSLCSGVEGVGLGLHAAIGAVPVWQCEFDANPSTVLAARFPGVPNFGDLKALVDSPPPYVDIITAGYPCQPFSLAGLRKGTDDPRHLWPYIAEIVRRVGPRYVFLENVRGHLSMGFDAVLGSLADLGFHARWEIIRASDVGAPHRRERLFIVARNAHMQQRGSAGHGFGSGASGTQGQPGNAGRFAGSSLDANGVAGSSPKSINRGPAAVGEPATFQRAIGPNRAPAADAISIGRDGRTTCVECGGRQEAIGGESVTVDSGSVGPLADTHSDRPQGHHEAAFGRLNGHADPTRIRPHFGRYETAVQRWEHVHGVAPHPLVGKRLNASFVEWMMGFPAGWVTDILPNTAALKALGNAVVPQVAATAWRLLATDIDRMAA